MPSVKVGQTGHRSRSTASRAPSTGTVSQVGPVAVQQSGYSYPVVVDLPSSSNALLHRLDGAMSMIDTGSVSNVVAVPTSAVETAGSGPSFSSSTRACLTRKVIKVGMVGDAYTQVLSGVSAGQSVVLADYAEAVPRPTPPSTTHWAAVASAASAALAVAASASRESVEAARCRPALGAPAEAGPRERRAHYGEQRAEPDP